MKRVCRIWFFKTENNDPDNPGHMVIAEHREPIFIFDEDAMFFFDHPPTREQFLTFIEDLMDHVREVDEVDPEPSYGWIRDAAQNTPKWAIPGPGTITDMPESPLGVGICWDMIIIVDPEDPNEWLATDPEPCPLCKSTDITVSSEGSGMGSDFIYGQVKCNVCSLSISGSDEEDAILRWNTR